MIYFALTAPALPPLERTLYGAIHGGARPSAGRLGALLRARRVVLPCQVMAVYLGHARTEAMAKNLRGRAVILAVHPAMAYLFFREGEAALRSKLRRHRWAHGPSQTIVRAAEAITKIQNAIVELRAHQLIPLARRLGPLSFEDEVCARTRAVEAVRLDTRNWRARVTAWNEIVLVRHYRQLNTIRRKLAEFLTLLTRDLGEGFGVDFPFACAMRELYATFAIQDLAERFPSWLEPLVQPLVRCRISAPAAHTFSEPVARALNYMQAHATEPIGLAETAASVHISAPHLSRRFHRETGRTLTEHLQSMRIEHAKDLLAEGNVGVLPIALRSGFPSLEHFYRVFKKRTGMTPRAWRRAQHA